MRTQRLDIVLLAIVLLLVFFGLAMIASVSVYESFNKFGQNDFYFWRRILHMLFAFGGFFFCFFMPYRFWEKISLLTMIVSLGLLILVFTKFGSDYGSSNSWIDIPFLPSIQPVEFAKFGLIIYLSHWMSANADSIKYFHYGFVPFTVIVGIILLPLALQPDFGSILVISLTAVSIFLVAGGSIGQVTLGACGASVMALVVIMKVEYIYNRFATFLHPELDTLGISYQIKNALTAIGSGGFFGLGFGQSIQKNGYLPEVQGDTIFAAIAEEMGFLRTFLLIALFLALAWRGFAIARNTHDRFAKLVATGFTTSLTVQMLINVGVNMGLLPNTGITLPFISYGGTSLLVSMMMVGIMLNISMTAPTEAKSQAVMRTPFRRTRYAVKY